MTDIPQTLAAFTARHWDDVPAPSLALMRLCLFDWAVVALAAHDDPLRGPMQAHAAAAGPGPAALVFGGSAPARAAALHNGTLSHALDFDDTHFGHIGHVSTVVIPAALAAGQSAGAGFDDILIGARLGAEVATRIGLWLGRSHYQAGFHQTATSGAFGATVAAIRAGQGDPTHIAPATRIVAGLTAGLKAQFGTAMKPMNAGFAAAHGVEAAALGPAGARRILGGDGRPRANAPRRSGRSCLRHNRHRLALRQRQPQVPRLLPRHPRRYRSDPRRHRRSGRSAGRSSGHHDPHPPPLDDRLQQTRPANRARTKVQLPLSRRAHTGRWQQPRCRSVPARPTCGTPERGHEPSHRPARRQRSAKPQPTLRSLCPPARARSPTTWHGR
jgi:hypothetical protein